MSKPETYDFSGYVTKHDVKCDDGATISQSAFQDCTGKVVPLVYMHDHKDPTNVLGNVTLEHRAEGVYGYGRFNDTEKAKHMKLSLKNGDLNAMSIHANKLQRAQGNFITHGNLIEVSLVLAGANPSARIDDVIITHGDGLYDDIRLDEGIIHSGLNVELTELFKNVTENTGGDEMTYDEFVKTLSEEQFVALQAYVQEAVTGVEMSDEDRKKFDKIYGTLTEEQADIFEDIIEAAEQDAEENGFIAVEDPDEDENEDDDEENDDSVSQSTNDENTITHGGSTMNNKNNRKNALEFEQNNINTISHSYYSVEEMNDIINHAARSNQIVDANYFADAEKSDYDLSHAAAKAVGATYGVENVELAMPDAKDIYGKLQTYNDLDSFSAIIVGQATKYPKARTKMTFVDITAEAARARGYIKGNQTLDSIYTLINRSTDATNIYVRQQLDLEDLIGTDGYITAVTMKTIMKVKLQEEIARAILIGDGRPAGADKIDESRIIPIAKDKDIFTIKRHITGLPANATDFDITTAIRNAMLSARIRFRGIGTPTMFVSPQVHNHFKQSRDAMNRLEFLSPEQTASSFNVKQIVDTQIFHGVEIEPGKSIAAIIVNPMNYTVGSNNLGKATLFENFTLDFMKQQYVLTTTISGMLNNFESAILITMDTPTNSVDAVTFDVNGNVLEAPKHPSLEASKPDTNTGSSK